MGKNDPCVSCLAQDEHHHMLAATTRKVTIAMIDCRKPAQRWGIEMYKANCTWSAPGDTVRASPE